MSNVELRPFFEVAIDEPVEVWRDDEDMATWATTPKYVHLYAVSELDAEAQATANLKPGESIRSVTQIS